MRSVHVYLMGVLLAAWCLAPPAPAAETVLHVAVHGDDAAPGAPARPLATIAGARDALRRLKAAGHMDGPVQVRVGPGRYFIAEPIEFAPEDSGSRGRPIVYQGAGMGKTVVSGGILIKGWRKGPDKLWQARVPEVAERGLYFHQLFVNGRRAHRAVSPNTFYHRSKAPLKALGDRKKAKRDKDAKLGFRFHEGDFARWPDLDDVMVTVYHSWTASLHWIADLDMDRHVVRFTNRSGWPMGYWEKQQRYQIENHFAALDSPGEWYLHRATGVLSYWPRAGEDMAAAEAIAPVLAELVRFAGDSEVGMPVERLSLRNMSFQHADWQFDRRKPVDGQAHCSRKSAAIKATGLRNSVIESCEVAHVGSHAIWLEKGCQDNRIARCHIHDVGGGGVYIGEASKVGYMPPDDGAKVQRNTVDNCFIHNITHVLHGSIGIWVGSSSLNTLSHNEISDFDYTGISVGWCWGRKKDIFQHSNIIEYNHVHHTTGDILSDNGGIYVLGYSPHSAIRNNLVHHIFYYPYVNGSRGIYLDGNTSEYLVENNICHDIGAEGIVVKGEHNVVRNNVFAFCGKAGIYRLFKAGAASFGYEQDTIERNIVLQRVPTMTLGYYHSTWTHIDHNLYWSLEAGPKLVFNDRSSRILKDAPEVENMPFDQWQALGRDAHSVVADPRFTAAEAGDFRLAEGSPARQIGYKETDTHRAGLYGPRDWVELPKAHPPGPLAYAPPPAKEPIDYGFEDVDPGESPVVAGRMAVSGEASILVTDEAAASGRQSLKFTDAPGIPAWQPHWYLTFKPRPGQVTLSCDLMLNRDAPATARLEFRDWPTKPWKGGPTVTFGPDGQVQAGGSRVASIALGEWVHVQIEFQQGQGRPGGFTLRLGQQTFDGLAFANGEFVAANWYGFSTLGRDAGSFYLDNFRLTAPE